MPQRDQSSLFPRPDVSHPISRPDGGTHKGTVFLAAMIDHRRITVGDYTYASAHEPPADWAARIAPFTYEFSPEKLIIGKFCQIADGVVFITASANHRYDGISTYPFAIFGGGAPAGRASMPAPGSDTVIGNDVWIGQGAVILPGARLGDGVIVGAGAVVSGDVRPYTIVAGNPARLIRERFSPEDVQRLQKVAWWDWPIEDILAHEAEIMAGDVSALVAVRSAD